MKLSTYPLLLILLYCVSCAPKLVEVKPDSNKIDYVGRINFENKQEPVVYWSGSSITIRFKGSGVSATLNDEKGLNYFNVVIDGDSVYPLKMIQGEHKYELVKGLDSGKIHTVALVKRNEWITGQTGFKGYTVLGKPLEPVQKNGRLIEFYGNSITAGYAIENLTGSDNPDSTYTNNYNTYAALTARHFGADLNCIVRSGIGIMVSWDRPIMPEIWDRLNPVDSLSKWDFSKSTPDIVVVNLFQNDCWLVERPNYKEFKYRFGDKKPSPDDIKNAYADFIRHIRAKYPQASIICALGSMDATNEGSPWPGYVKEAVASLNDSKIYTHFFPFINKGGHPRVEDDKKMADSLIKFIEENIEW